MLISFFAEEREAETFRRFLPTAGAMIPFVPAQLKLAAQQDSTDPLRVSVERNISVRLDPTKKDDFIYFF